MQASFYRHCKILIFRSEYHSHYLLYDICKCKGYKQCLRNLAINLSYQKMFYQCSYKSRCNDGQDNRHRKRKVETVHKYTSKVCTEHYHLSMSHIYNIEHTECNNKPYGNEKQFRRAAYSINYLRDN